MESHNFLTLHREQRRHAYFSAHADSAPFFDPVASAWIVTNPALCRELLGSSHLHPPPYAESLNALAQRLGTDFVSLLFAFSHIPLCLHGDRHRPARRRASEFLAARKGALNARLPAIIATNFGRLRHPGRLDLMHDIIVPAVRDIISILVDMDVGSGLECRDASFVLDRFIGVAKRRRIEQEIATLRDAIADRLGDEATEDDIGLRLTLLLLGKDPLIGTVGESLRQLLDDNPGLRLSDIDYPELPPQTGIPFVERVVAAPFEDADCAFKIGDKVRIFLQSFAYVDNSGARTNFFGAGAHACPGRPVSIDIWKEITAFLSDVPLRASVLSYAPRSTDYMFTCPEHLHVELRQ
jgi:cytochrome P450